MTQQEIPQPKAILRGHASQVHVTTFVRHSERLASGDADGYVVLWDLTIMRPRAVWRPHDAAILGISGWGDDKVITQGRDNRLIVWKITADDEKNLSTDLPLDENAPERPKPWMLFFLEVNTMNFCSFARCSPKQNTDMDVSDELFVAVPNALNTEAIDIFHLPSQNRMGTIQTGSKTEKKGMVMALSLFWRNDFLFLLAGYENGLAVVARRRHTGAWDILYKYAAHSQPILSLDVASDRESFFTSGADAIIARHPVPNTTTSTPPVPGQRRAEESEGSDSKGPEPGKAKTEPFSPIKVVDTKHSGQQALQMRSDGRIFATAGWDSKVRVYSAKTMSELAVLKWHDVGCYAAAFSVIKDDQEAGTDGQQKSSSGEANIEDNEETAIITASKPGELSVKDRRIKTAKEAHWLAAGSKDGKISLWDIY
ncbi:WD40 repeat-like protein [Astrocystis sublimbata]|nr:WD40 repeat-like protein [Astrocystis sublimbata]